MIHSIGHNSSSPISQTYQIHPNFRSKHTSTNPSGQENTHKNEKKKKILIQNFLNRFLHFLGNQTEENMQRKLDLTNSATNSNRMSNQVTLIEGVQIEKRALLRVLDAWTQRFPEGSGRIAGSRKNCRNYERSETGEEDHPERERNEKTEEMAFILVWNGLSRGFYHFFIFGKLTATPPQFLLIMKWPYHIVLSKIISTFLCGQ